jgi:mannosyltransferase
VRIFLDRWRYLLVFIGALAVHTWHLTTPSLWWDEAATKASFRGGWAGIDAITLHLDVVHKLYYQLIYLNSLVFGNGTLALRLPSAIAAALACVAIMELARQLGLSRTAQVFAGAFLALTPRLFWASLEARSYSMTVLTGVVSLLLFVVAVKRTDAQARETHTHRKTPVVWWLAFTAVYLFAVYLYLYQLLMVVPFALFLLQRRAHKKVWFWAGGSLALVAGLAVRLALTSAAQQQQVAWNRFEPTHAFALLLSQAFMDEAPLAVAFTALLLGVAIWGWRRLPKATSALALAWALGPAVMLMTASLAGDQLYNSRYVSFTLGGWALLAASVFFGTENTRAKPKWLAPVLVVAMAAAVVVPFGAMRSPTGYQSDWALATVRLDQVAKPGDAVIFGDAWMYPIRRVSVMKGAYPEAFRGLTDVGLTTDASQLFDERASWHLWHSKQGNPSLRLTGYSRIWLILDSRGDRQEIARADKILGEAGYRQGATYKEPFTWLVEFVPK